MTQDKKAIGFTQILNSIIRDGSISVYAKMLYICISSHGEKSYASYPLLMKELGISRPTIAKSLNELVDKGLIKYVKGNSSKRANEYVTLVNVADWTSKRRLPVPVNDVDSKNTPTRILIKNRDNFLNYQPSREELENPFKGMKEYAERVKKKGDA